MFRHYGLAAALLLSAGSAQALHYDSVNATEIFGRENGLGFEIKNYHGGNLHLDFTFERPVRFNTSYFTMDYYSRTYFPEIDEYITSYSYLDGFVELTAPVRVGVEYFSTHAVVDSLFYQAAHLRHFSLPEYVVTDFAAYAFIARDVNGNDVPYTAISSGEATVPEPSAWAMLVIGFGLVGRATRRKPVLGAG